MAQPGPTPIARARDGRIGNGAVARLKLVDVLHLRIDLQHDIDPRLVRLGGDLAAANGVVFGETARAIVRNALVIAVGFSPMAFSPLGPYLTVGVFFALLMLFSALTTLGLLPGLLKLGHGRLWRTAAV